MPLDDLPKDTNEITCLTVEQANALVERANDRDLGRLFLNGVTSITPEVAAALAKCNVWLCLNGLAEMSPQAADTLAKCNGRVELEGLMTLNSVALAAKLAKQEQQLHLPKLASLSADIAEVLVEHGQIGLYLKGLSAITPEVARTLAQFQGELSLEGLDEINAELSNALLSKRGGRLYLCGSNPERNYLLDGPEAMVKHEGKLVRQESITQITPSLAKILAQHQSALYLPGVATITQEIADELAKHDGSGLWLPGLTAITCEVAEALSNYPGHLGLDGLNTITTDVAVALAKHKWKAQIFNADDYCDLEELGRDLPYVYLDNASLFYITSEVADELSKVIAIHDGLEFYPGIDEITPQLAEALVKYLSDPGFGGESWLSEDTACVFAISGGTMSLDGLKTITCDVAEALAKHRRRLSLKGLTCPH